MADNRRWADAQNPSCISDSRTVHSHIYYAFMSAGLVGVVDELKLKALPAISTQIALYT